MRDHSEDTDRNLRTIFLISIFSLFVIVSSNNYINHHSSSIKYTTQSELVFINISSHNNIIASNIVKLPDLQKYYEHALNKTDLNQFSIQYKISDHNRRIALNFIQIQKTRLTIEPLLLWRLCFNLSDIEQEYLPVLS